MPVTYQLEQQASAQISFDEATSILDRSFAKWAAAICPGGDASDHPALSFKNLGPTDAGDVTCDGAAQCDSVPHVILFLDQSWPHNDTSNTLALTTIHYGTETGHIYAANTEINSAQHKLSTSAGAPAGAFSLEPILTHEAGHFVGLAHSQVNTAVMYAFYGSETIALTPDDVSGVCAIYPPTTPQPASGCSCAMVGGENKLAAWAALSLGTLVIVAAQARRRQRKRSRPIPATPSSPAAHTCRSPPASPTRAPRRPAAA
jgi:hypothetical protein